MAKHQAQPSRVVPGGFRSDHAHLAEASWGLPIALAITRAVDGVFRAANPAFSTLCGYELHELVGHTAQQLGFYPGVARPDWGGELQCGREYTQREGHIRTRSGATRFVLMSVRPLSFGGESCLLATLVDINERHTAQGLLRALVEARTGPGSFAARIVARVGPVLDLEFAGLVTAVGRRGTAAHLVAFWHAGTLIEDQRMPWSEAPCSELAGDAMEVIASGLESRAPATIKRWSPGAVSAAVLPLTAADGRSLGYFFVLGCRPLAEPAELRRVLATAALPMAAEIERTLEVEHKRRMEQQLVRSQKFEALGTLAGGVAHDFNNLLGAMLNYAQLARNSAGLECDRQAYLDKILCSGHSAQDLVRQILSFSRRNHGDETVRRVSVDLADVVKEVLSFFQSAIPKTIVIERRDDPGAPPVLADPTQLQQVVMNLCVNAAQAIAGAGRISIELAPCRVDAALADAVDGLTPGFHARLTIRDTGAGMDETTMAHIFEPYFTTKPVGEGTGLGLALVWRIIRAHGGGVDVHSRVGEGSVFELYLPAAPISAPAMGDSCEAALPRGHGQHILVIDDDASAARSAAAMLQQIGYRATVFEHADKAVAAFWASPGEFALVLTNPLMPELSGLALMGRLRAAQPSVPIVLFDGNPESVDFATAHHSGVVEVLAKPASLAALAGLLARYVR